jgi:hypothetical protein
MKENRGLRSRTATAFLVIAAFVAFAAFMIYSLNRWNADCAAVGGTLVRSVNGYTCIKRPEDVK